MTVMKLTGKVIEGQKIGQKIGFPTANIALHEQINPGIYAGKVELEDKNYSAALYISSKRPDILEAHILDWKGDIYGKDIWVEVLKKIRDDRFFKEDENIAEVIENDIKEVRQCLQAS